MVRFSVQVNVARPTATNKMERLMFGTLYCRDYQTAMDTAAAVRNTFDGRDDSLYAEVMAHVRHRNGVLKIPVDDLKYLADTLHEAAEEVLTSPTIKRVK